VRRSFAIGIVLLFLAAQSRAQILASPERAAAGSIAKKRWSKAESQLRKALRKDSLNVVARYLLSGWFFKRENPAYNTDSSYHEVMRALSYYPLLSSKIREKMKRFPLDSIRMIRLREQVDSTIFRDVKNIHTEKAYIQFLRDHPFAREKNEALQLRDEVAYLDAINNNTHEGFLDFLNKYPLASNAPEARKKYERLLYESRTNDRHLSSYEQFLQEYPETPFRNEIEKHIFELFTLSGEAERYLSFLQAYPSSHLAKKAQNILFHILQEQDDPQAAELFLTDSLRQVSLLQESYLAPFLKNGKFGLIDKNGHEVVAPVLENLSDEYKCGNIKEDIIGLPGRILARNGKTIFIGETEDIDDVGSGFLLVTSKGCNIVLHKSGFVADSSVTRARVLNNRFLAILQDSAWRLVALNGKRLVPETWDDVLIQNNVVALKKKSLWYLVTLKQLATAAEEYSLPLPTHYEEVKMLPNGLIWTKIQGLQGILDQTLQEVIPLSDHVLTPSFFGFLARSQDGYAIYDLSGKQASSFEQISLHEPWLAVRKNGLWRLFDPYLQEYQSPVYDSIRFEGPFVLGTSSDTLSVHFNTTHRQSFKLPLVTAFIPGKDSTSFISIESEGKKTVYNASGKKLFTTTYDQIQYAGEDLFIVHKKEKKGLINKDGKMILPIEFDAIGSASNHVISLLRNMKFGLYQITQGKLIKPQFDKNLIPYTTRLVAAFRDGLYSFINWDNKPEGAIQFEEIQYWNDTTALLKINQQWSFYTFATKTVLHPNIKAIRMIRDTPDEKLAIIQQPNAFGVVSNKRGLVIPLSFSDLVNVGSPEEPLYFTEKHVEEASVFVVIYYDRNGKFLRREVYQEADDYEKIYCPDK
jgi:hypothetical protein